MAQAGLSLGGVVRAGGARALPGSMARRRVRLSACALLAACTAVTADARARASAGGDARRTHKETYVLNDNVPAGGNVRASGGAVNTDSAALRSATLAANGLSEVSVRDARRRLREADDEAARAPAPIRMQPIFQLEDDDGASVLSAGAENWLKNNVLPAAFATIQRMADMRAPTPDGAQRARLRSRLARAVARDADTRALACSLAGTNLTLPVECDLPWNFPSDETLGAEEEPPAMCATVRDINAAPYNTCGPATVPPHMFGPATTCDCSTALTREECACTTADGGPGVGGADTLIFVTVSESCAEDTLAVAGHCFLDPATHRPLAGYMTLCKSTLEAHVAENGGMAAANMGAAAWGTWLDTIVHEVLHVLVYSGPLFNEWQDLATGEPYGSAATVSVRYDSGWLSDGVALATPAVRREAAAILGCAEGVVGVPLENQGAEGTAESHWEMRAVGPDELMAGSTLPTRQTLSRLTLATFEDSGWYIPRYEAATPLADEWGAGEGCGFFWSDCRVSGDGTPWQDYSGSHFCDPEAADMHTCTTGSTAIGACTATPLMDGCAVRMAYSNGPCTDTSSDRPSGAFWGQMYGDGAACMAVDESEQWKRMGGPVGDSGVPADDANGAFLYTRDLAGAGCFEVRCSEDMSSVNVVVGGLSQACPEGQYVNLTDLGGAWRGGRIGPCPPPNAICERMACGGGEGDNACGAASNAGHCGHEGKCACFLGHAGDTCARAVCLRTPYDGAPDGLGNGGCGTASDVCSPLSGECMSAAEFAAEQATRAEGGDVSDGLSPGASGANVDVDLGPATDADVPASDDGANAGDGGDSDVQDPVYIDDGVAATDDDGGVIGQMGLFGLPPLAILAAILVIAMCMIGSVAGIVARGGRQDARELEGSEHASWSKHASTPGRGGRTRRTGSSTRHLLNTGQLLSIDSWGGTHGEHVPLTPSPRVIAGDSVETPPAATGTGALEDGPPGSARASPKLRGLGFDFDKGLPGSIATPKSAVPTAA